MIVSVALALFNGSYIGKKNTGIGVVSENLISSLSPDLVRCLDPFKISKSETIKIPSNLSPDNGIQGHINRLYWVQTSIPSLIKESGSDYLLSPLPEAPLFSSVRSIVLAHDLIPLRYPIIGPLLAYNVFYVPLVLHQAKYVLCNSEATAREVHNLLKVPINKLIPIKLGFNQEKFYPKNLQREEFFLVMGRHLPHKNLVRVLKAFSLLKEKNYKLIFIGPSDIRYTPRLKSISKELGVEGQCIWKDWVSDNERLILLNKCRGLILASLWEGFGLPALEAMACGTPVIASNRGALPEVVGNSAILIDPLNYESIASAIIELINNSSIINIANVEGPRQSLGFSWKSSAKQIEKILLSIDP